MASIYIGGLYGYKDNNTSYGYYNLYFEYDNVTRNGYSITYSNARVVGHQSGNGYTTNDIFLDQVTVNGVDIGLSWSGKGSLNKDWSTEWKNITINNIPGNYSSLYVQWWGHRTGTGWGTQISGAGAPCPEAYTPTISSMNFYNLGTTYVSLSFSLVRDNGQPITSFGIQVSETDFGQVIRSVNAYETTITDLVPNKTYYARGYCTNAMGTVYTNVISFTTAFYPPGEPGRPVLSYDLPEPTVKARLTATWSPATGGTTGIAGYFIALYKNNQEIRWLFTDNTNTSYTFETFEALGCVPGDTIHVAVSTYCRDWAGNLWWSVLSYSWGTVTLVSDKYIMVSQNGGAFNKYKVYISSNGGQFTEIKKEKLTIIT